MKQKRHSVFLALSSLCLAPLLGGCNELLLFYPKGPVGEAERFLIIAAFVLMLLVVIPVFIMAFWFPLKYRASNTKATYAPNWSHSAKIETVMWLVPLAIILALSVLAWKETHRLDPYKSIDPGVKNIDIEVVSLDWKWLFIYPEQHIAVVNQLVFPANVPLSFRITSDTVMTSFFIPQLGSQIYAMAGMQTRLHLMADEPGAFAGQNQQFSGQGFSDMTFTATATTPEEFESWVQKVKQSSRQLDPAGLDELKKPSSKYPVTYFSSITPGLFDAVLNEYAPMEMNPNPTSGDAPSVRMSPGDLEGR